MIYQADWILPLHAPPIPRGWIQVAGNRIQALGAASDLPAGEEIHRLSGCTILPGLINAHCHLELSLLQGKLPARLPFPAWVTALRAATSAYVSEDYRQAARFGIAKLLQGGATTVVDVGNTGETLPALAECPLRSFGLVEVLGLDPALAQERFTVAVAQADRWKGISSRLQTGLAAHSAYACSPQLLTATVTHQKDRGLPFTFHACESREERELFAAASGPLQEFCRAIYPQAPLHRNTSPLQYLDALRLMPVHALVVHGNHLQAQDLAILSRLHATVVHCPYSHAFFDHAAFPFRQLRERGVSVCLGTDSLGSGDSLSMLDQMRAFRLSYPEVTAEEVIRMATTIPARALGLGDQIGILKPGFKADCIAVRAPPSPGKNPFENVLGANSETAFSLIDGDEVRLEH